MGFGGLGAAVCPPPRYLQPLGTVALGAVPLDDELAQVQQEDVAPVEAFPAHLHLQRDGGGQDVSPPTPTCPVCRCLHPDGMVLGR